MAGTLGAPKPTSAFILDGLPFAVEANKLVVASLSR
jgi:hypothetical protein